MTGSFGGNYEWVPNGPLSFLLDLLGADCVASVEAKLEQVATELNKWRSLAESTVFETVSS